MIPTSEHLATLVAHAYSRTLEVYSYQINIDNYTVMLESLPADGMPERLAQYSSTEIINLPADLPENDVSEIADYQYRDRLRSLLRTERIEQSKSRRVLDALKAQIGPNADALIDEYKAAQGS